MKKMFQWWEKKNKNYITPLLQGPKLSSVIWKSHISKTFAKVNKFFGLGGQGGQPVTALCTSGMREAHL